MRRSAARALVVGAGGLGSPAARALGRAGVGTIAFVDDDLVDLSNLQRQTLHRSVDAGRAKVDSAADALRRVAPAATVIAIRERLLPENALGLVGAFDVVLDGSDNFATKFLVNDACVIASVPFVHGGAIRWGGQLLAVARGAPCFRCLFEEIPPADAGASCDEAGIVGPAVGVVGALQAEAALALLDQHDSDGEVREKHDRAPGFSTLIVYDGLAATIRRVEFARNPTCRACGERPLTTIDPSAYEVASC